MSTPYLVTCPVCKNDIGFPTIPHDKKAVQKRCGFCENRIVLMVGGRVATLAELRREGKVAA